MIRYLNGVTLYKSNRTGKWPVILLLIVGAIILSACGARVANSNWPGMTAGENGTLYVAFGQGIVAVDLNEQDQLWVYRPQDANASLQFYAPPSFDEGKLVFGDYGASGGIISPNVTVSVYALDELLSPNPVLSWSQSQVAQDRIIAQPLQFDDRVIVGTADNFVVALERENGSPLWDDPFEAGHSIWGHPIEDDGVIFVPSLDKNVYALNAETGEEIWQSDVGGSVSDKPVINGDLVYVGSFDKQVHALDKATGASRWTAPARAAIWGAPAYADGVVYFADLSGNVFAVGANSGELHWEESIGEFVVAATLVEDGVVYVAGAGDPDLDPKERQGTLIALSAETGDELWREQTSTPLFATPVIMEDSIVIAMQGEAGQVTLEIIDLSDPESSWTFNPQVDDEG
jgi:outer membrane protein assembly factor BamB